MTCSEEWRPVPGFPRYEASDFGRVRSLPYVDAMGRPRKLRILTPRRSFDGHWSIAITKGPGQRPVKFTLGALVLEAFGYRRQPGQIVLHGPLGRDVNTLDNLSFGTYAQNNGPDRKRDGTRLANCDHPRTHLSENDVRQIRSLRGIMTQSEIGRRFSIDQTTVSNIQLLKSFKEIHDQNHH